MPCGDGLRGSLIDACIALLRLQGRRQRLDVGGSNEDGCPLWRMVEDTIGVWRRSHDVIGLMAPSERLHALATVPSDGI